MQKDGAECPQVMYPPAEAEGGPVGPFEGVDNRLAGDLDATSALDLCQYGGPGWMGAEASRAENGIREAVDAGPWFKASTLNKCQLTAGLLQSEGSALTVPEVNPD